MKYFRLRTLFIGVMALSIPLVWFAFERGKWREEQSALSRLQEKGAVSYYSLPDPDFIGRTQKACTNQADWLSTLRRTLSLQRIVDLEVFPHRVPDNRMEMIRQSPRHRYGSFQRAGAISAAGITRLGSTQRIAFGSVEASLLPKLSRLHRLDLSYTQISDQDLIHVGKLHSLKYLNLQGTLITNEGLKHLRNLGELRDLHLSYTGISDAGFSHLTPLGNLETFTAWGNDAIRDSGLVQLTSLTKLKYINLSETQASDDAVRKLRAALPGCDIHPQR